MISAENLNKTWFVDIDGTLFIHRTNEELDLMIKNHGPESHLQEAPIQEAITFLDSIPKKDKVLLTTARESDIYPILYEFYAVTKLDLIKLFMS